jgi:predicted DNA-binding transcriptional regulator AlpA
MNDSNSNILPENGEKNFLCRKELACYCQVSLSTVDRGIRANRWPYNAYVRLGVRMIGYPKSLLQEIEQSAKIRKEENYE